MTSPPPFAARAGLAISASTLGPASLSHVYMHRLLDHWRAADGLEGFVSALQRKYARAAGRADAAAARHLAGLASWARPAGGMFMWLRLEGIDDAMELLEAGPAAKVAVVPGSIFWVKAAIAANAAAADKFGAANGHAANGHANGNGHAANGHANGKAAASGGGAAHEPACPFFRVSFVSVADDDLEEGFARLACAIRALRAKHGIGAPAPAPAATAVVAAAPAGCGAAPVGAAAGAVAAPAAAAGAAPVPVV